MSINQIELEGFLGRDPEWVEPIGRPGFIKFSLATNQRWFKDGQEHKRTDWHSVVCFDYELAQSIRYQLKKGSRVRVRGSSSTKNYVNKQGLKCQVTTVVAREVNAVEYKKSSPSKDIHSQQSLNEASLPAPTPAYEAAKQAFMQLFGLTNASVVAK